MYTQQFGYYPGWAVGTPTGGRAVWPVRLRPFVGGDQCVFHCPSQDPQCEWEANAPGPVVFATEFEARYGYEVGERVILTLLMRFSYGYNASGTHGDDGENHMGLGSNVAVGTPRMGRVRVPEDMIAVTGD